ncbi:hypothetical protein [Luethyella okanaganae]|uniref:Uncharacterized protein n=1 Tax=Luethyella okanaganae TaxID=69372 RepID=A0ABW1VD25_9MICO
MTTGPAKSAPPKDAVSVDVTSLLGLGGPHARTILVLFLGVHALLAFANPDPRAQPGLTIIAFLSLAASAVWSLWPAPDPFPFGWTLGVLTLCTLTAILQTQQVTPAGWPTYATWHLGAITLVLFMLILRGRPWLGWAGYGIMSLIAISWAMLSGLGPMTGVGLVVRHAATLVVATMFAVGLRRTAVRLTEVDRQRIAQAAADATARAAEDERVAQLARLDEVARPMMERVARGERLSAEERRECLLIEASLRDVVRGRGLAFSQVLASARTARERGVEVTLLDDSGTAWGPVAVADLIVRELRELSSGRLTARLLPAGRDDLAVIVTELAAGESRMLTVNLAGRVREG